MGFFESLKRVLGGDHTVEERIDSAFHLKDTSTTSLTPVHEPEPFQGGEYDRKKWRKKLKLILEQLPESQQEWPTHLAEGHALGISNVELATWMRDEFALMVRRVVADRIVTHDEHEKLDLARKMLEIPDTEAEAILHEVVAEAEKFFGKDVKGA